MSETNNNTNTNNETAVPAPAPFLGIEISKGEKILLAEVANYRTFSSGKKGYGVYGKMSDVQTGKRYQLSINIVEIEPKA